MKKGDFLYRGKEFSQKKGLLPFLLRSCLKTVSFFWGIVSFLRNFCYDRKLFSIQKVSPFVVSVGNLVAGGTGKTPFTLLLAEKLIEKGASLAILSRGYGSSVEREGGEKLLSSKESWQEVGDEPFLFKERLQKKGDVIVGKNRFLTAKIAEKKNHRVLLLDDGMQARFLHRDLEITLLNGQDLFGQNEFLPFGYLRENPSGLKRSDLIILNHVRNKEHFEEMKKQIRALTKAPIVGVHPKFSLLKDLEGRKVEMKEGSVSLFCAIAQPHFFCDLVKKEKFSIVETLFLSDHGSISPEALVLFAKQSKEKGAQAILCTEKDKIKLSAKARFVLPIYYVEMELEILEGKEIFDGLVKKILNGSATAIAANPLSS